jgi:CheY-like chemotaxis protein
MTITENVHKKNRKDDHHDKSEEKLSLRKVESMTVLIVDDEQESILPLKRLLQDEGCTVYFLNNGKETEEFLSSNENIKLVFLDWNMPQIEGGEALVKAERDIAADDDLVEAWSHRNIPVVTYTGANKASISLPRTPHFAFIDHWPKTMRLNELRLQVESVMAYLKNRGH